MLCPLGEPADATQYGSVDAGGDHAATADCYLEWPPLQRRTLSSPLYHCSPPQDKPAAPAGKAWGTDPWLAPGFLQQNPWLLVLS